MKTLERILRAPFVFIARAWAYFFVPRHLVVISEPLWKAPSQDSAREAAFYLAMPQEISAVSQRFQKLCDPVLFSLELDCLWERFLCGPRGGEVQM
jgi:hypothetical protein